MCATIDMVTTAWGGLHIDFHAVGSGLYRSFRYTNTIWLYYRSKVGAIEVLDKITFRYAFRYVCPIYRRPNPTDSVQKFYDRILFAYRKDRYHRMVCYVIRRHGVARCNRLGL